MTGAYWTIREDSGIVRVCLIRMHKDGVVAWSVCDQEKTTGDVELIKRMQGSLRDQGVVYEEALKEPFDIKTGV